MMVDRSVNKVTKSVSITSFATATLLLMVAVSMTVTDGLRMAYALPLEGTCAGHSIVRGDFDTTKSGDEVKIDGTVYYNGNSVTIGGITYKITIVATTGLFYGTSDNNFIVGTNGNDTINGDRGDDIIVGLGGDDYLYGDALISATSGFNDILCGNDGNDYLYGDYLLGEFVPDNITGGNDVLDGGDGNDVLYGDYISGDAGNDNITGGNDIIDARDGTTNNDYTDCDFVDAETYTLGDQDIYASDPDPKVNCEYDDISTLATLTAPNQVQLGESVQITFSSTVDNPVKITSLTVTTPTGDICTYSGTLPIIVPANGTFTATYPIDFTGTDCNTDTAGTYTVVAITEVGDPITTNFTITFQVVPEAIAGALGIVGTGLISMLLYRRVSKGKGNVASS